MASSSSYPFIATAQDVKLSPVFIKLIRESCFVQFETTCNGN